MQLSFALDFPFATLGVQGIAVSPIHMSSMESVVGFSSFGRRAKKKKKRERCESTKTTNQNKTHFNYVELFY